MRDYSTMNDTLNTPNDIAAHAIAMSDTCVEASVDLNNCLVETGKVKAHYGAHYANAAIEVCGIVALVMDVLRDKQAVFPRHLEQLEEARPAVIACSLFTSDIVSEVQKRWPNNLRYKPQAVKNVLSTYGKQFIVKVQLTKEEDTPRPCSKPRAKWYLIQKKS